MADAGGAADALQGVLQSRDVEVLRIDDAPSGEALVGRLERWRADGPVAGVYWLPALDDEGPFAELSQDALDGAAHRRVKLLYRTMRALYEEADGKGAFLVSATRMGGALGFGDEAATAPLGGAVSGFTKAYARERPEALVKVLDFGPDVEPGALAQALVEETLRDPGAVEIARGGGLRRTPTLVEVPVEDGAPGMTLGADTVFFVTGAAGSITSAIVSDLATAAGGGQFYLLDLAPAPGEDDEDLKAFVRDREALKRTLFERFKAEGTKATPKVIEAELAKLERKAAAATAIARVEAAGGQAHYRSLDLRDSAAVAAVVDEVRAGPGRIDVLLHAGGLEISRTLPDKSPEEFDLVFDVKTKGWHNVLSATQGLPIAASVVFSSIAGRFGNAGQADYASANDLLAKTSFALRGTGTRALVMDWTAWGGIGMATRGSIPTMMALAGIDMLPPEAGIAFIRRELTSGGRADEVVVAQGLGVMLEERHPSGGLDLEAEAPRGPMLSRVVRHGVQDGLLVEFDLDPSQPFLDHHRIDGTPVLPGVMGIEAFCEVAAFGSPGWRVTEVRDVEFLAPFKLYRSEPRTAKVYATFDEVEGERRVRCRLEGERKIVGRGDTQRSLHFSATVVLSRGPIEPMRASVPAPHDHPVGPDSIYAVYFHGPSYQVVEKAWGAGAEISAWMKGDLGPDHLPKDAPLVASPRLVELCFQTAGVAEIGRDRRLGLPSRLGRIRWPDAPETPEGRLTCAVRRGGDHEGVSATVVDEAGAVLVAVEGYHTMALPSEVPEALSAPLDRALD